MRARSREARAWRLAALGVALSGAAAVCAVAAEAPRATHTFQLTYRDFGPVSASSDFTAAGPISIRFEGCYAKDGPEAVCGFTLRARTRVIVTNLRNLSHGTRADGLPARTCCMFEQGRPEGFPIVPSGSAPGVADIAAAVEPGRELGVMLRLPDYRAGAPLRSITFSRGEGDPGATFPATVRSLPAS